MGPRRGRTVYGQAAPLLLLRGWGCVLVRGVHHALRRLAVESLRHLYTRVGSGAGVQRALDTPNYAETVVTSLPG